MVSRRDLLLGLGASLVALATLPGCQPAATVRGPQQSRRDVEAWAIAAVDELVRHGTAAWCNVIRTQHVELVLDVVGESQALATTWQLQLGLTRADGSSEIRTIEQISQASVETTVAAMIGTQWRWAPPNNSGPAIQAYGALQPVVQRTPQQPWRAALRQLHATLVPMLHSRIIYHAVALQQQVQERWRYQRTRDQSAGQKFAATVTRQLWQCTTATRQREQLDFVYAHRGSSKPTPAPEFTDGDLQDLLNRALRHATPSEPPRGAIQVLLAPDITATLLIGAAQRAELDVPQLRFDPLQAEAYGRTPWRDSELPTQAVATSPAATAEPTVAAAGRDAHPADEPAHFSIAGGTAALTTLRDQPTAVYLLEAADISVSHTGAILIWPSWALELVRGVTSGRAYRMPIVRTTLAAINAAQASSDRATVVVPAPLELAAVSSAGAPAPPTTMWSATAPWLLLPAEFA